MLALLIPDRMAREIVASLHKTPALWRVEGRFLTHSSGLTVEMRNQARNITVEFDGAVHYGPSRVASASQRLIWRALAPRVRRRAGTGTGTGRRPNLKAAVSALREGVQ